MQEDKEEELQEEPEFWEDLPDDILRDIDNKEPLPEPHERFSITNKLTSLLQWFVLFILLWQANCKISDNGLEWLLRFMFQFLHLLGVTCQCDYLVRFCSMFPTSLYVLRQLLKLDRDDFVKYVVCPKCSSLYDPGDCTQRIGGRIVAKSCTHKAFKKGKGSKECGTKLAQKVVLSDGKEHFYPYKVYCFNSVINQIEAMLKRPNFAEKCEQWRQRKVNDGFYSDVYDGQVWKDFLRYNGRDFLNAPRSLAFALNVDWFQPYTRRSDVSVGVIYLVLMNLPREERFKWENVILVGIIPDMETMPKSINPFLRPLVDEMKVLWRGIRLHSSISSIPLLYRAAILLAASDIPAARKLCGLKGHSARRGCSKCFKPFPGSVKSGRDFSGFDRENWPKRCNDLHRKYAEMVRKAVNKTTHEKLATQYGCYFSVLLELEYFDAIRFTVIDPMHNLFLGTAKMMFQLWLDKDLLTKAKLKIIEERIHSLDVGTGVGRLPHKISSNHGRYKASQWKNWTLIYSVYALHGLLPEEHLNCWHTFVMACRLLTVPTLSCADLTKADMLLLKFCRQFEVLYGKDYVRINMHLHCHLKECVEDYGPVYSFWCFAFERFNGVLGSTVTNNRSIEIQLMRKFLSEQFVSNVALPEDFSEHFSTFFNKYRDSLSVESMPVGSSMLLSIATSTNLGSINWSEISSITLPSAYKLMHLDADDRQLLAETYQAMYPEKHIEVNMVSEVSRRYVSVHLAAEKIGSKLECRSLRSARVMASWAGNNGKIDPSAAIRPGFVKFLFVNCIKIEEDYKKHVFACIQWYREDSQKELYRRPVEVWRLKSFNQAGPANFMPVRRCYCKFASSSVKMDGIDKLIVSPIQRTFC